MSFHWAPLPWGLESRGGDSASEAWVGDVPGLCMLPRIYVVQSLFQGASYYLKFPGAGEGQGQSHSSC